MWLGDDEVFVENAGLISINRTQCENRLCKDRVPMDRCHAASLEES